LRPLVLTVTDGSDEVREGWQVRRLRVLLSIGVLVWVLSLAAPARASTRVDPTLVVTPSTGLKANQVVEVTGTNWPANTTIAVNEGFAQQDESGQLTFFFGPLAAPVTGPDGSFTTTYTMKRVLGGHDCAALDHNDACYLFASGGGPAAYTGITFAPK
jgi:hypothetical protein